MIVAMINIPEKKESILYVIIQKDNHERMREADPITLESERKGGMLHAPMFAHNFSVLIAYEEDNEKLMEMAKVGGIQFLQWLERGRKFDPKVDGPGNARPYVTKEMN